MRFFSREKRNKISNFITMRLFVIAVIVAIATLATFSRAEPARAAGTITTCDEPSLVAAINAGGNITFGCSGMIMLSSSPVAGIDISKNTTLDATGQNVIITVSPIVPNQRIFKVNPGFSLTLKNITLTGGKAKDGTTNQGWAGGAVLNSGTLVVIDSKFLGNEATEGGAIANFAADANLTISGSFFGGNKASNGGAIINFSANQNNIDTTFFGNNAASNTGSAIVSDFGTVNINNSAFTTNNGVASIYNQATLNLTNSTISNDPGGGIGTALQNTNTANVTNSTLSVLTVAGGAAISNDNGTLTIKNSIVHNRNSATGEACSGSITNSGNNLQWPGNSCGAGINSADPKLDATPLNNGGLTPTIALLTGSPAINTANPALCPATDQRGFARVSICDIGAFEFGATSGPIGPNRPENLTATTTNSGSIDLQWLDKSDNETSFWVERRTGLNGQWQQRALLNQNVITFSDTVGLNPATLYCYHIRAGNNSGFSEYSNEACSVSNGAWFVTSSIDNGSQGAGTLSKALNQASNSSTKSVVVNLSGLNPTLNITGQLPAIPSDVTIYGLCQGSGPAVRIQGSAGVNGLQLNSNVTLYGLKISGFAGPQIKNLGNGSHLGCVKASKI